MIRLLMAVAAFTSAAAAQTPKEEGEDLAESLLPSIQDEATAATDADKVPGFVTDDPAETGYYGSSASLETEGAAAALTDEASLAIQDSMELRPVITASEIDAATAPGFATQEGAPAALPDFTGSYGGCTSELIGGSVLATCADDTYCISGTCETASREQNDELPEAAAALQMMASLTEEFDETSLEIFAGGRYRCRTGFGGANNCCGDEGFIASLLGCPTEAQVLNEKQADGQCTYVGKYCSSKVLGVCLQKRRSYCCFDSKLSRIINEQGRAQIGKTFGSAKSPNCEGFGVEEFQMLDLAAMDLSEFYEDALATVSPPSEGDALPGLEAQIAAFYD